MKKIIFFLLFLTIGLLALANYFELRNFLLLDFQFSWVSSDVLTRLIIISCLTIGFYLLIKLFWKKGNSILIGLISFVLSFGVSFYQPIYIDDFGITNNSNQLSIELIETHFPNLIKKEEALVISFFTSTCPFCKSTAQNFNVNKEAGLQPKTIILFPSIKEDAEQFFNQTNTDFEYALITDKEFIDNAGHKFPSVFLIENGKVTYNWVGSEINYSVLDYLRGLAD